ncbi:hypothetical protein M758_3G238800 [Ceratodon purpureus]|nr:hypothetical protein M758_3G238800 [Ceratodon purpureus]
MTLLECPTAAVNPAGVHKAPGTSAGVVAPCGVSRIVCHTQTNPLHLNVTNIPLHLNATIHQHYLVGFFGIVHQELHHQSRHVLIRDERQASPITRQGIADKHRSHSQIDGRNEAYQA